ncbi:MAG: hypothetical protein ACRDH9_13530 [Actinomycetota bacterium]
MRRLITVLPLVLLVMAPTGVRAAVDDLVVCDAPAEETAVLKPGTTTTIEIPSPELPGDTVLQSFQLDLYPAKAINKATVGLNLSWQVPVNDYDVTLIETGQVSDNFQTLGDPPLETVGDTFLHCDTFSIEVLNFLAVGGPEVDSVDPLQLVITTGNMK